MERQGVIATTASPRDTGVQSVARAVAILERLAIGGHQTVRELADATGLHRTTVHRLVRALVDAGWVVRLGPGSAFALSVRFRLVMGSQGVETAMISRLQPVMETLCDDLRETIQAAVLDGDEIVHVAKCECKERTGIAAHIGQRAALYNTALGKAVLFSLPDDAREAYIVRHKEQMAPILRGQLETERRRFLSDGYTVDNEESFQGVRCVGVSLRALGFPFAALSVTAPANRLHPDSMAQVASRVQAALGIPHAGAVVLAHGGQGQD